MTQSVFLSVPTNRITLSWRARVYRSTTSRVAASSTGRPMSVEAPNACTAKTNSTGTIQTEEPRRRHPAGYPGLCAIWRFDRRLLHAL